MHYNDAVKLYVSKSTKAKRTIERLVKWQSDKSCEQNSTMFKTKVNAYMFARKYGLKFKQLPRGRKVGAKLVTKAKQKAEPVLV